MNLAHVDLDLFVSKHGDKLLYLLQYNALLTSNSNESTCNNLTKLCIIYYKRTMDRFQGHIILTAVLILLKHLVVKSLPTMPAILVFF